jgi:5'(3')-deoxyribonucleotidase
MTIWFDMDGTIADLYGVENWLPMVRASDPTPYMVARPLVNLSALARILNRLHREGYEIGVISWTSKTGTPEYNAAVTAAKYAWLSKHLPSVDFDEIHVVPYGTPKQVFAHSNNDILFDDEAKNRENWTGLALDVTDIIGALKAL